MARIFSIETIRLVGSIVLCLLAGFVGSFATTRKIPGWYATIHRPSFSPPNWLFGPVWTLLYILMGIALYLVWRQGLAARGVKIALLVFSIQLVLNASWSFAFFGAESPLAGLVVIVALWAMIMATIASFAPVSRAAAALLVPYILWVSFATVLNASIYAFNR
jgi:benzodiazapine receptor